MIHVASLELCKELYELSGWDSRLRHNTANGITYSAKDYAYTYGPLHQDDYIAYDLAGSAGPGFGK